MATIDIFNDDAFGLIEMTAALEDIEYKPNFLGTLGIFIERSVRTETVFIERKGDVLSLVQSTPRGAPLPQLVKGTRNARNFNSIRIAKGDRLTASEIAGVRAFGSESEFESMQGEVATRAARLMDDIELTHENMRLGAIQGLVVDADGSTLFDWATEWSIALPAEQTFVFADLVGGKFREKCNQIIRAMARAAQGAFRPTTTVHALCGDEFYDNLIRNDEIRETYKNWQDAQALRGEAVGPWESFPFGRITWHNYRGTDDGSKVAVPVGKCKFFPVGAADVFQRVNTPGEWFDVVNTPGQQFYGITVPDRDRNMWVDVEVYSYPLYICTRPGVLARAKL